MSIRDPVTGYEYPEGWVLACTDADARRQVVDGLAVLTSGGTILRRGFTTGTTAAAACKAAVLSLRKPVSSVFITLPCGLRCEVAAVGKDGSGSARKYSGDYTDDITANMLFCAEAQETASGITIHVGEGIGRFVRETPRYAVGDPAVSPPSWTTIRGAAKEAADELHLPGVVVKLTIPDGAAIGRETLNPKVGVIGGISVLGSTGLVEPWDDHLSDDVFERIRRAERPVLTTGRVGLRYARMLFPDSEVVLVGKFMGKGIEAAGGKAVLCGLPALILKFINPDILDGSGYETVEESTMSENWTRLLEQNLLDYKRRMPNMRVVIVDREGHVQGDSQ
ncbi:cobalt-precorrin-5B (C(1))-methyltransferase [Methanogenium organophilum]|uniref:Cobalt-precorrin-5B C(1)-methyltransferase n=1 Tax=Methanogenium organophilum TaxID=2199 RepID=A0A9X9T7T4_METOG|nr:cobalt-precorrin-5B (C(1))-methyltransferase [Methanogenium organophilum]WAI01733.1 cobalt-precorrin-5B (C(1))-methyltransferase [Methanogenium organophilum]